MGKPRSSLQNEARRRTSNIAKLPTLLGKGTERVVLGLRALLCYDPAMREQTTVLYEATNLDTQAALAGALAQIQEYFGAQPSFPHNVLELAPCGPAFEEPRRVPV